MSTASVKPKKKRPGDDTRAKIMDATLEGLRTLGIAGISARTIASIGDFNQALIFYHYGSIDECIISAVNGLAERRMEEQRERLENVSTLTELIAIARELHLEDRESGAMTIFVQAFAGASGDRDPMLGPKLHQSFSGWTDLVSDGVSSVLGDRFDDVLAYQSIGRAISTLFLGIELIDNLDPTQGSAEELFDTLAPLATLLDNLLASPLADHLGSFLENPPLAP